MHRVSSYHLCNRVVDCNLSPTIKPGDARHPETIGPQDYEIWHEIRPHSRGAPSPPPSRPSSIKSVSIAKHYDGLTPPGRPPPACVTVLLQISDPPRDHDTAQRSRTQATQFLLVAAINPISHDGWRDSHTPILPALPDDSGHHKSFKFSATNSLPNPTSPIKGPRKPNSK